MFMPLFLQPIVGLLTFEVQRFDQVNMVCLDSLVTCTTSKNSKQTSKRKHCNFPVNRDHTYKKKGNKGGHLYTCRYSRGHLIPVIQSCPDELGIKCPLEYLQCWIKTEYVSLLFYGTKF